MAKFGFSVADTEYSERGEFEIIPKGTEVTLKATEAEEKKTSAGTGSYIAVEFEITKGEYVGRKVWQNFNVNNPNDKAEKIGREQIAGWARACGKPNAQDTDELLERPFNAKLGIEKGTGGYSDKNKIDSFLLPGVAGAPAKSNTTSSAPAKGKFDDAAPVEKKPAPTPEPEDVPKSEPAKPAEVKETKRKNPWDD